MKNKILKVAILATSATLLPLISRAAGVGDDLHSLQGVLQKLYDQMLPLCSGMIGIARGIAGFGALWFIAARIWKHVSAAEPVDIYPLLRPFVLGFCIVFFQSVLALINGILQPVVTATQGMVTQSNLAIARMLKDRPVEGTEGQEPSATNGDPDKWYQYSHPDQSTANGTSSNPISDAYSSFSINNWIRKFIAEVLNVLFQAAALCLDTIRTFKLIVLAILGPLCFGLSVFDGFQHTLKQWIARYVNVFMWLPIANIFGAIIAKIQENMILERNQTGLDFSSTNTAYLIFLLIGIVGYFTVPSVANYIMNVGGHALFNKASALTSMAVTYAGNALVQSYFKGTQSSQSGQSGNSGAGSNTANRDKLAGNGSS
ncbi:conjugative transposon protein TraJ [Mucilaginibacter lappiensis]|uniref:Conjugative transposon TraJ protein n=1 Tax=Mucilaginibacter lappiensis TaxID=354630 RepID=A0A841JHE0_9SPHI|nr:conjugative transposon protein TraJ [Mucilaginibacter lappiensis]MBB6127441.1 conjugative transposon TraJ protein [Mucilaginibacter lappiensis]